MRKQQINCNLLTSPPFKMTQGHPWCHRWCHPLCHQVTRAPGGTSSATPTCFSWSPSFRSYPKLDEWRRWGTGQKPRKLKCTHPDLWELMGTLTSRLKNRWRAEQGRVPFSCSEWHHIVLCLEAKEGRSHVCLNVCNGCNAYVTIRIIISNRNARLTSKLRFSHLQNKLQIPIVYHHVSNWNCHKFRVDIPFFLTHPASFSSLTSQPFIQSLT